MTSPWPRPDYENNLVMCCLCFETISFEELSKNDEGYLTDVCIPCREKELYFLSRQNLTASEKSKPDAYALWAYLNVDEVEFWTFWSGLTENEKKEFLSTSMG